MRLRTLAFVLMTYALFLATMACAQSQVAIPDTNGDAQLSDKALFEKASWDMETSKYAEARTLLETLINSNPDSDYVPRAKLTIGDAWNAEGCFKQAEMEYRDFITFFPNRPEVSEAQRKLDSIQQRPRS